MSKGKNTASQHRNSHCFVSYFYDKEGSLIMIVYKELSSLTEDLGFSEKTLYAVSNTIKKHYHKVKIPKENGEVRELLVPDELLKAIQRKITDVLLSLEEISPYATAYRYGGSTVVNAKPHLKNKVMLKLDIRQFFDHIIYPLVKEKAFPEKRYSESNRVLLTLLCTYKDALPQGAPTSPAISNIIMKDFDDLVGGWCNKRNITYTRYCDDMTFSGDFKPGEVILVVKNELEKMGFFLNAKKTVILHRGQKKIVTGIVVNEKLNVPVFYRKEIRKDIYYCKKYGVKSHLENKQIQMDEKGYLRKLLGKINYVLSVDSDNKEMSEYKEYVIKELNK